MELKDALQGFWVRHEDSRVMREFLDVLGANRDRLGGYEGNGEV